MVLDVQHQTVTELFLSWQGFGFTRMTKIANVKRHQMSITKCSFHSNLNLWDFLHWETLQNLGRDFFSNGNLK